MAGGFAGGISEVLSGKKNLSKGIKVEVGEKETRIDVNIIVEYGTRIPDVAFDIQNRVKISSRRNDWIKSSSSQCTCTRSKHRNSRRKQYRKLKKLYKGTQLLFTCLYRDYSNKNISCLQERNEIKMKVLDKIILCIFSMY